MRVCFISDTHNNINELEFPKADLLIHSGDATGVGSIEEVSLFNNDLGKIKDRFKYGIIFVAGNHDFLFETNRLLAIDMLTNATYLENSFIVIEGYKIYGVPHCPKYFDWAFMPSVAEREWYMKMIPKDTDILVTHTPPQGILDWVPRGIGESVGCEFLKRRVMKVQPKIHAFGHIHSDGGKTSYGLPSTTTFINAAMMNDFYTIENIPIVVDLKTRKITNENEERNLFQY